MFIDEILQIANQKAKEYFKKTGRYIDSRLPKTPFKKEIYRFFIGDIQGEFEFKQNWMLLKDMRRRYTGKTVNFEVVAEYLKIVAKETDCLFLIVRYPFPIEVQKAFLDAGFLMEASLQKYLPEEAPRYTFLYITKGQFWDKYGHFLRAFQLYLKKMKRENPAFRYTFKRDKEIVNTQYYYAGNNSQLKIIEEEGGLYLVERKLKIKRRLRLQDALFPQFESCFAEIKEQKRLENLLNPDGSFVISQLEQKGITYGYARKMFDALILKESLEDLETKVVMSEINISKPSGMNIYIAYLPGYYFVYGNENKIARLFKEEEKAEAFRYYKELSLEHVEQKLDDILAKFEQ